VVLITGLGAVAVHAERGRVTIDAQKRVLTDVGTLLRGPSTDLSKAYVQDPDYYATDADY